MIIRTFDKSDVDELKVIHERYYQDKFPFPDFFNHFVGRFSVVDDTDRIISAGGVRLLLESVIITDKAYSLKQRRNALLMILQASLFCMGRNKFDQLHAFIQDDEVWVKALKHYGFQDINGKGLVING